MKAKQLDIGDVGAGLVQAAAKKIPTPQELLQELFPYVFEASRKLSTHAISRWLKENHGIDISQPTVSRALRKPEKHWQGFADFLEPRVRIIEEATESDAADFLGNESLFEHLTGKPIVAPGENCVEAHEEFKEAVEFIRKRWFSLARATRATCLSYMRREEEGTHE